MDPNKTLGDLRWTLSLWDEWGPSGQDAISTLDYVTDLFLALDTWLSNGGFRPDDWS